MKNLVHYYLGICLFMLFNQLAIAQVNILKPEQPAQVNNLNPKQPNAFEKFYGTQHRAPTRGTTDALVYIDMELQPGRVLEALTHLGYSYVVATSWSDFNSKLSYPTYQLAVMFNQSSGFGADLITVTNYISAGGSMVYADWTHTASFATLFQATFTGVDNETVMTLSSTIATGLPNPLTLVNTGWGTYSTGLTATGGANVLATFPNGNAAIVRGNSDKTIILGYLSDVPPADYRQQLFENLFVSVTPSGPPDPTSITASVNPICNGFSTQLTANGADGTVYWYTGSCGGTQVTTGNPVTVSPASTTTYYARNYNNAQFSAGCASLQVVVNQPSYSGIPPTVASLQATGTGIKWYANSTGGSPLLSSTNLVNGNHYYASQTVNGCESKVRFGVTATVDPTPCAPTGPATQTKPIGATVASLTPPTGSNIRWYYNASGGSPLDAATLLVNGHIYYATQTVDCTESAGRLAVTVTIGN